MEIDPPTEIYTKLVLAGGVEDVRQRIIEAVETLGYTVIEDSPHIVARRGSKGWASWSMSADVLDVATTLTVRLKPTGENSTRAIFEYIVKSPIVTRGEKRIVLQEAKTIAALSKKQAIEKLCAVCETESTDDSKFCRKCGAPLASERIEPELLRVMAEARAAKTSFLASTAAMTFSVVLFVLLFIFAGAIKAKLLPILFILGGLGVLFAALTSLFGHSRLTRALEQPEVRPEDIPRYIPPAFESEEQRELPPPKTSPASVTEATTNLLDKELTGGAEKVPVSGRRQTNDLE